MTAAPAGYSRKTTTAAAAPPAGYSKRVEEPTSGAPPSIWQQLFDVKNARTGESYLYGNTPAPTQFEDIQRTGRDTLTRGYLDKYLGPEEQAKTERARERMPDWVELPTDVATSVVGSPYRAAGAGWGAVAGGLEGAANAFGHQRDGSIGWDDAKNILWEGGKGAALGSGFSKLGDWAGKLWSKGTAKAAQPFKTTEELDDAATKALYDDPSGALAKDLMERVKRSNAAQYMQGADHTSFAKMLAGMGGTEDEIALAAKKGLMENIGDVAEKFSFLKKGGGLNRKALAPLGMEFAANLMGVPTLGGVSAGVGSMATLLSEFGQTDWARKMPKGQLEELQALIRDPNGRGLKTDPETVRMVSDLFAKMGIGTAKSPVTPTVPEVGEAAKNAIRGAF